MTKCTESGCRALEWKCADCGRVASTATIAEIKGYWDEWMEWTSVEDGLPPKKGPRDGYKTLITDGKHVMDSVYCHWTCDDDDREVWTWVIPHPIKKVTHWMLMPEPPK